MRKILFLFLLACPVEINSLETIGSIECLNEKLIPANPDSFSIAVDYDGKLFLTNSRITLILNTAEKQFLLELLKQTQTYFETVETDTITLPIGFLIGKLNAGTDRITVYFSTDGRPEHSKVYLKITGRPGPERPLLFTLNRFSLNKEHCLNLIKILEESDLVIQDLLRQKALFSQEAAALE